MRLAAHIAHTESMRWHGVWERFMYATSGAISLQAKQIGSLFTHDRCAQGGAA